ncbi:MAG: glycosyltransferase family 39 protein [Patescibacteria group bacterium]
MQEQSWWKITKTEGIALFCIIAVGFSFFLYKTSTHHLDRNSDYLQYIETAKFFGGDLTAEQSPSRILKPLAPAFVTFLSPDGDVEGGFLIQMLFFYVLLVLVSYLFFRTFFNGSLFAALSATALFSLSYPMLRYGLDFYTETGALFFYVAGLLATLLFIRTPKLSLVIINAVIAGVGFLVKEYSIVHLIIFNVIIIFYPRTALSVKEKIKYLIYGNGVWVVLTALWQLYVWSTYHYTYLDWYLNGGLPYFYNEGRTYMITKSFFALLMIGWFAIPFAYRTIREQNYLTKLFLFLAASVPFLALVWGAISSRLFYVFVPALAILCVWGIERLTMKNSVRVFLVVCILISHIVWLLNQLFV